MASKQCGKCQVSKLLEEFRVVHDKRTTKSYTCSWCKGCEKERALQRYHANRDKCIQQNKEYKKAHQEEIREKRKVYLQETSEYIKERYRRYCDDNRDKINQIAREYRNTNPQVKIKQALSNRLREVIKKQEPTSSYLGAPMSLILDWFSFNFDDTMTLQNHGSYWHIDHAMPIKSFNLDDTSEYDVCFSWMNLMPLDKLKNIKKSNNIILPRIWHQEMQLRRFITTRPDLKPEVVKFLESYKRKLKTLL